MSPKPNITYPKGVLFDWDGTIVDTDKFIYKSLQETFQHFGKTPLTLSDFHKNCGQTACTIFKREFKDQWPEAQTVYYQTYLKKNYKTPDLFEGIQCFLELLKDNHIYCAIVSNKKGDSLREEVEQLSLSPYFSKIIGATDAPRDKPFPDPVHLALKDSGLDPARHPVWFIGDRIVDMECAHKTFCIPVEVSIYESKLDADCIYRPHLSIQSFNDLIKTLK